MLNWHNIEILMTRRVAILVFTLLFIDIKSTYSYTEDNFKDEWSSPFKYERSKSILKWGAGLTLLLAANRSNFVDPLAEDIAEDKPLGQFSRYGDYAGQTVPNLMYIGYMMIDDSQKSMSRAKLMFKATAFSGISVFLLKRMINQRRPDGGDRNSHPSGHTTTAFAFASVISLEHPHFSYPAYLLATFVGLSRMNDNVHYLHDVIMGAAIGSAFGHALYDKQAEDNQVTYTLLPINDGGLIALNYDFD